MAEADYFYSNLEFVKSAHKVSQLFESLSNNSSIKISNIYFSEIVVNKLHWSALTYNYLYCCKCHSIL